MNDVRFDFSGRVAIVTGAANGIGAACARLLAASHARVALWDIDVGAATALATELSADGSTARAFACDVSRKADVDAALQGTLDAFGRIDALVNNAGIFRAAWPTRNAPLRLTSSTASQSSSVMSRKSAARAMAKTGGGAVVNMSSVNGVMAIPSIASYNASKGGIDQLTRVMSLALAPHRIRVNAVGPGTIATELARKAVLGSAEAEKRIMSRTPLQRLGEPAEVAGIVAFLLSDASAYVTGEIVYVDGGRRALNYTV